MSDELTYTTGGDPEAFRHPDATWHAKVVGNSMYLWRSPSSDDAVVAAVHGFEPVDGGRITSPHRLRAYLIGKGLRIPFGAQRALLRALAAAYPGDAAALAKPEPEPEPVPEAKPWVDLEGGPVTMDEADFDRMAKSMAEAEATIARQTSQFDHLLGLAVSQAETIQAMDTELRQLRRRLDTGPTRIDFQHPEPPLTTTFGRTATWRGPTSA
jgi:hypothetical protein